MLRKVAGFLTSNGKFHLNEALALEDELKSEITRGFQGVHSSPIHHSVVASLLLEYIVDNYTLVKK